MTLIRVLRWWITARTMYGFATSPAFILTVISAFGEPIGARLERLTKGVSHDDRNTTHQWNDRHDR